MRAVVQRVNFASVTVDLRGNFTNKERVVCWVF